MTTPAARSACTPTRLRKRSAKAAPATPQARGQDVGEMAEPPVEAALEA